MVSECKLLVYNTNYYCMKMHEKEDSEKVDCITEQEKELGSNALSEFQRRNYGACLQNINKLDKRQNDFKVMHNKYVAEYYKSDLKKTNNFQKNLTALFSQFQLQIDKLEDIEHCFAYYNQAVLYFQQKDFTKALKVMEKVYKFIEPIDESLAKHVGLLLVELHLNVRQLDKATNLINCLENQIFSINQVGKLSLKNPKPDEKEDNESETVSVSLKDFQRKIIKYKARCFLMTHKLADAKIQIDKLGLQDKKYTGISFMKAHLEYLQGNYKEAIDILENIPAANLTYHESGESGLVMQSNNIGAVYHAMGKANLATHYYQKALREDMSYNQNDKGDKSLLALGASRYHEIVYNLGISLLHAGRPTQAFDCLIIAVRRYHRNSRLFLRLAECCIQVHKASNEPDFDFQEKQKHIISDVIGSKQHRKVTLTKNLLNDKKYSVEGQSYAVPVPTLEFALLCLRNAYLLLPSETDASPVSLLLLSGTAGTATPPPPSPGPAPSSPLSPYSVATLKNAILAASAYVCLCLGDYVMALEHAKNLLSQPKLSGVHRLLGHLYAAEALVMDNKVVEAIEHLNPEMVQDISFNIPLDDTDSKENNVKTNPPTKWFPLNLGSAQATVQYNLAVCWTLQRQFQRAKVILRQAWHMRTYYKVPAIIFMLALYIELQLGEAEVARTLITDHHLAPKAKTP